MCMEQKQMCEVNRTFVLVIGRCARSFDVALGVRSEKTYAALSALVFAVSEIWVKTESACFSSSRV
jgi:hypothetical protein